MSYYWSMPNHTNPEENTMAEFPTAIRCWNLKCDIEQRVFGRYVMTKILREEFGFEPVQGNDHDVRRQLTKLCLIGVKYQRVSR